MGKIESRLRFQNQTDISFRNFLMGFRNGSILNFLRLLALIHTSYTIVYDVCIKVLRFTFYQYNRWHVVLTRSLFPWISKAVIMELSLRAYGNSRSISRARFSFRA